MVKNMGDNYTLLYDLKQLISDTCSTIQRATPHMCFTLRCNKTLTSRNSVAGDYNSGQSGMWLLLCPGACWKNVPGSMIYIRRSERRVWIKMVAY